MAAKIACGERSASNQKLGSGKVAAAKKQGVTTMDKTKLLDKLNECLRHEWTGVAQYAQAGFVVAGLWREVYSEMFFDSAKESFSHAKLVERRLSLAACRRWSGIR
jgi:ferritin-like protein